MKPKKLYDLQAKRIDMKQHVFDYLEELYDLTGVYEVNEESSDWSSWSVTTCIFHSAGYEEIQLPLSEILGLE